MHERNAPMNAFSLVRGQQPLLCSMPHVGTALPDGLSERLSPPARALPDTDWLLPELYDFLPSMGVSLLQAHWSRQVVDLNRPPDDSPLYDTATTGLVPETLFDGTPAWREGEAPTPEETARRLADAWRPYHDALDGELQRLRSAHGEVVLLDLHSIRSHVPRLFRGRLPDLNIGTFGGRSCEPGLTAVLRATLAPRQASMVVDGRFQGGYITRHYGRPRDGVHAVQLELSQITYMDPDAPPGIAPRRAATIRPLLQDFVQAALDWIVARTA